MWSLCSRRSEFSTAVMIHRRDDPSPGGTLLVRIATHRTGELRRKDHVVTAALKRPTDYLLRVFIAVSGVDEVDARVERFVDDPDRVLGVGVADPGGEHERAERVGADLDAGSAEVSVPHEGSPDVSMTWVGACVDVRWHQAETLSVTIRKEFPVSNRRTMAPESARTTGSSTGRSVEPSRRQRSDAQRNVVALVDAAKTVFAGSGVDAPAKEITDRAGVGVGTLYRHFPRRSDLIVAVLQHEIDECVEAAELLASTLSA